MGERERDTDLDTALGVTLGLMSPFVSGLVTCLLSSPSLVRGSAVVESGNITLSHPMLVRDSSEPANPFKSVLLPFVMTEMLSSGLIRLMFLVKYFFMTVRTSPPFASAISRGVRSL